MPEFAPTVIETEAPEDSSEAIITELPTNPDDSKRYDADFAYDAARLEDIQRDKINQARDDVDRALAQNSPLVDKYKAKLTNAEVALAVNAKETEKFYDRFHRQNQQPETDELRLAA